MHEHELRARYGIEVVAEPGEWEWGGLRVRGVADARATPTTWSPSSSTTSSSRATRSSRTPSAAANLEQVRASVMDVFMALPDETRVLPGHTDETTIGRERAENPFVQVWSGAEPEGSERVTVGGREATLVVWSPDYDGKGKAWVRFDDGEDAIVGGSRVRKRLTRSRSQAPVRKGQ